MSSAGRLRDFARAFQDFATSFGRGFEGFDASKVTKLSDITVFLRNLNLDKLDPGALSGLAELRRLQGRSSRMNGATDFSRQVDELASAIVSKGDKASIIRNKDGFTMVDIAALVKRLDSFAEPDAFEIVAAFRNHPGRWTLVGEYLSSNPNRARNFLKDPANKIDFLQDAKKGGYERFRDGINSACSDFPTGCRVGRGIIYTGAAAGLSIAAYKFVDAVFLDDDDKQECVKACLPSGFYESDAPGAYGDLPYEDLTFLTHEQLSEAYGANINQHNQPLCTEHTTNCLGMCQTRCDELNTTLLEDLTTALTDPLIDLSEDAGDAAGEGLAAFLDGIFGEGMGIPAAIAIFIVIVIVMMVVM
jgi:hypothetical protein